MKVNGSTAPWPNFPDVAVYEASWFNAYVTTVDVVRSLMDMSKHMRHRFPAPGEVVKHER